MQSVYKNLFTKVMIQGRINLLESIQLELFCKVARWISEYRKDMQLDMFILANLEFA